MPSTNAHKTSNTDQRMRRESEPERMGHRPPDSVAWFLVQFCFVELTVLCGWRTCFFMNIDKFMCIDKFKFCQYNNTELNKGYFCNNVLSSFQYGKTWVNLQWIYEDVFGQINWK